MTNLTKYKQFKELVRHHEEMRKYNSLQNLRSNLRYKLRESNNRVQHLRNELQKELDVNKILRYQISTIKQDIELLPITKYEITWKDKRLPSVMR